VLKGAVILQGMNDSSILCTIRNMHEGGAELRVPGDAAVPESFLLFMQAERICYRCEVRWRGRERVGVQFLASEPKPRWYHG
jgi:hypothetical protein